MILCLCSATALADPPGEVDLLQTYFNSLRIRGFYTLAEEYATTRLAAANLPPASRAAIGIELARTLVEHGIASGGAQRLELWDAASRALQNSITPSDSAADRQKRDLWQAILLADQGAALAFQTVLQPEMQNLRKLAIDRLTPAIQSLQQQSEQLEAAKRSSREDLSNPARLHLRQQADFSQGQALLWLSRLELDKEKLNSYLNAANRALDRAGHGRTTPDWVRQLAVAQARVARFQGEAERAGKILDKAAAGEVPIDQADHILAERVRLELQLKHVDEALKLIIERIRKPAPPTDEVRAMAVESLLQAAEIAIQKMDDTGKQMFLAEARQQHERTFGIWRLQTTVQLQQFDQNQQLGTDLALLVREAVALWQSREIDAAVEKYGRAASLAFSRQLPDQAFEFALTRASILLQNQRWKAAESALNEIVSSLTDHPRVAEADLLRCYAIGQRAAGSTEYQNALLAHLSTYPGSPTTADIYWMLAVDAEQQQRLSDAITFYRKIPAQNPRREEANQRILMAYEKLLLTAAPTAAARGELQAPIEEAIQQIARPLLTPGKAISLPEARSLLQAAQLCLQLPQPLLREAGQILPLIQSRVDAEQHSANELHQPLNADWTQIRQRELQLRIILLASQKQLQAAHQILQEQGREDPSMLLSILSNLTDLTAKIDAANLKELGALQRITVQEIAGQKTPLSPGQQLMLNRAAVQASIALEDWPAAIAGTEDLLVQFPNDKSFLHQLIQISMKQGLPADLNRAKEIWIRLEKLEPKGTTPWINARIQISDLLFRTGDPAGAKKILGVTRTLYPQLGSPELKQQGDDLWKKLQ